MTASLLQAVMVSEVKPTFYKINVHAALTPDQILCHLQPAIEQANYFKEAYDNRGDNRDFLRVPFVTVCVLQKCHNANLSLSTSKYGST